MAEVRIRNLYKRYGKDMQAVVIDFQLDIKDKEFIVFVGLNGCLIAILTNGFRNNPIEYGGIKMKVIIPRKR